MEPVNYERVREYSQKVLERQPDNAKALVLSGPLGHYGLSVIAFLFVFEDANVRRYLQLTQSELSSYHRKEKQLYLGMFG
ncbi:hypothetical protein A6R68_10111 [Neotoma lepida]|uniref:Uncharacterized protein n=1 Tax=Neotoma lepida TaxID=56216 RepID=A0A1A6FXX3_NEOLE|nr:hypothetical protein A6R68_10111 [Neotoma lepida]